MVCLLLLAVKGFAGESSCGFPNGTFGCANDGRASVAEFYVLVFGSSRGASSRDGVAFAEILGGVKLA